MSFPYNDQFEEQVYEQGYDKGYEDCRDEMEMKIKAILRYYLYSENYNSAFKMASDIGKILENKAVSVGE